MHPNADHKAFNEAYRIALWKADNQKRGIISGGSLGAVDISLSSETDDKGDSAEDSDSSEDGLQAIRDDLLRQGQVSPPSSPKANRFLTSLMKSPTKLQLEEQSKQDLDKEPLSLVSPTNQARLNSEEATPRHKAGDVTGQGGSVSASLGLSSLVSVDNAHQLDRQTAADTIRNGSLLSSPQPTEASRINSIASSQVEKIQARASNVPRVGRGSTPEERIGRIESIAWAKKRRQDTMDKDTSPDSLSPESLAQRTKILASIERDLAIAKRLRENIQEGSSVPPAETPSASVLLTGNPAGQRVLTETFVVKRLEEIRQFAGDAKLENFRNGFGRYTREAEIARIFGRFQRENGKGDPPYYCVSAAMLGRLTHTFREDYLEEDRVRRASSELALHAKEITEEAKKSMQEEAKTFERRAKALCDKRRQMIRESQRECERTLAAMQSRLKVAFDGYSDAFERALSEDQKVRELHH